MCAWAVAATEDGSGPEGHTYAGALVRLTGGTDRDAVLGVLRELRFTGWLGPVEGEWVVAVAEHPAGIVAAGRRGILDVAGELSRQLGATVVAVRVAADRQLVLAAWSDGDELGRYVSDPSHGLDDDEVLDDPMGVEHAEALAAAAGMPDAADGLGDLLAEELDHDSVFESERLTGVLRLLSLPQWLVASASLPRDVPGGPRRGQFTRLGAGVPGLRGRAAGRAAHGLRKRRRPAPVVVDPPRGAPPDPWLW
jgi:hypothetical protein